MAELQYTDMILNGFFADENLLKSYLIRKQKEVERENFVTEPEFIKRCYNALLLFENDIENQYLERKEKSKLIEKTSRENFYVQLSSFTDNKFKGELWHNQIQYIKKCIDEISNHSATIDIAIQDLDVEKYLNFVFSHKSISRESKKNAILKLIEDTKSEKTISTYRIWIDYVFNQQNYWIEPTEEERKLFDELRAQSLQQMKSLFDSYLFGNSKPTIVLEKEFQNAVIDRLSKQPFQDTFSDFINGILPKDLKKLAMVIGKLDFIKTLHNAEVNSKEKNLTLSQIALKCYYEGKKINSETAKKELESTQYKSSAKLYSHFAKWSNRTDRLADTGSKTKLYNKIEDFERVIEVLPSEKMEQANNDLDILKSYIPRYEK